MGPAAEAGRKGQHRDRTDVGLGETSLYASLPRKAIIRMRSIQHGCQNQPNGTTRPTVKIRARSCEGTKRLGEDWAKMDNR